MKKVLVDAYCAKNVGDDLFLKILFDRYKNVEFYILHANDEYKEMFKEYNNVFLYRYTPNIYTRIFNKITKYKYLYKPYDALVYIGGSIFMQEYGGYELYNERNNLIDIFNKNNKDVFVIGSNFGPYSEHKFKESYEELFKKCTDVCFREKYSYDMFSSLDNVRVSPDVVFQLKYPINLEEEKIVGISMIELESRKGLKEYSDKYYKKLSELANKYISLGYKIKLFSFCETEKDEVAGEKIISYLDEKVRNQVSIYKYDGNLNEFLDEFSKIDTIIATRFHAMILGLVFGKKVLPVIYSDKTYNVLKDLGLEENCVHIKDIENADIDIMIELSKQNILKDKSILKESENQFLKLDELLVSKIKN